MTTFAPFLARAVAPPSRLADRCSRLFCPLMRSSTAAAALKVLVVLFHVIFAGALFVMDRNLTRRVKPWSIALYLALLVGTLIQYFFMSRSSPGYVTDAMRAGNETRTTFVNSSSISIQSASRNNLMSSSMDYNVLGRSTSRTNSSPWLKLVMDLYPPGSSSRNWTCAYCNIIQEITSRGIPIGICCHVAVTYDILYPSMLGLSTAGSLQMPPRSKHCYDCDKCILQYDHHCIWLGTCIGQQNHCRFWWYIFEETVLGIWTSICYISFLRSKIDRTWWKDFIAIVLLAALIFCLIFLLLLLLFHSYLVLTNQTTYEVARRRRILYLRGIPSWVCPFGKGIIRNMYTFCCTSGDRYALEAVPTMEELEALARPYTCLDIISCRCC